MNGGAFGVAVGLLAGGLTTLSFMPQAIRILKTRSAKDLSYTALLLFIAGISLWIWYGCMLRSLPVVLTNAVTLALNLAILVLKMKHHER